MDDEIEETPEESAPDSALEEAEETPESEEIEEVPEPLSDEVIALAEEPGLWMPHDPKRVVFHGEGFAFVNHGRSAWVHRLRLQRDQVERTVNQVGAILAVKGLQQATWWVGSLGTPKNLSRRLREEFGLVRESPFRLTSLLIDHAPAGEPAVEVRRVTSLEEHRQALEIDWESFSIPEEERELRRQATAEEWEAIQADGQQTTFLAYIDDEPVGFGRVISTRHGSILLGGATLPEARGQGVYTSLVHARWQEAVDRGVPRVVVSAGPQSGPILEKVGFEPIGWVRLLRQSV